MTTAPLGNPAPGWYPNPAGGPGMRYWMASVGRTPLRPGASLPQPATAGMSKGKEIALGVGGNPVADTAEGVLLFIQAASSPKFTKETEIQGNRMRFVSVDLGATPVDRLSG